jgi:hypothetical protein
MIICEVCNHEIANGQTAVHKVIGWVEVKGNKVTGNVIKPSHALGYAHKICLQTKEAENSPTLF